MQITLHEGANATFYDIHGVQNVYIGQIKGTRIETETQPAETAEGFRSCILQKGAEERLLAALHSLMDGKTGKPAVLALRCASQLGLITTKPTYRLAKEEFPRIGASSGYYKYLEFPFNESETAPVSMAIRKMMEEE
jgi:hypothetical protein